MGAVCGRINRYSTPSKWRSAVKEWMVVLVVRDCAGATTRPGAAGNDGGAAAYCFGRNAPDPHRCFSFHTLTALSGTQALLRTTTAKRSAPLETPRPPWMVGGWGTYVYTLPWQWQAEAPRPAAAAVAAGEEARGSSSSSSGGGGGGCSASLPPAAATAPEPTAAGTPSTADCRICHEHDAVTNLVAPCACKGTGERVQGGRFVCFRSPNRAGALNQART